MFGVVVFYFFCCFVITAESGRWDSFGSDRLPECKHLKYDPEEYELFNFPIDFYANSEPVPDPWTITAEREQPQMKKYYNILPSPNTDKITLFGYRTQSRPSFTMMFGETDDQISFMLTVKDGVVLLKSTIVGYHVHKPLPEDFAIELDFAVDGVLVTVYDTADEENPTAVINNFCTFYNAIPTGIGHMVVFTDCETVEFEMVTVQTFAAKPTLYHMHVPLGLGSQYEVQSSYFTLYSRATDTTFPIQLDAGKKLEFDRRIPLTGFGTEECTTELIIQCTSKMSIYGTYYYFAGDFKEFFDYDESFVYGIWFLCTEVNDKECKFDKTLLQ